MICSCVKSILRLPNTCEIEFPDGIITATRNGEHFSAGSASVDFSISSEKAKITLFAVGTEVLRLNFRWKTEFSPAALVLGDSPCVGNGRFAWNPLSLENQYTWYINVFDKKTYSYGVEIQPSSFCFWRVSAEITELCVDVRNGGDGVILKEPLVCASVVERESSDGESAFDACAEFCRKMCPKPLLPTRPVFGTNNWYYAYGKLSRDSILTDTAVCAEICGTGRLAPYMVIDAGWTLNYDYEITRYNGGPFVPNAQTGDMATLAECIEKGGCIPGIWFRPTLTAEALPDEFYHPAGWSSGIGKYLDLSNENAVNYICDITSTLVKWGYKLLKHDFSSPDLMGTGFISPKLTTSGWHFYDRSRTNAEIYVSYYKRLLQASGDALILSCNAYNHLTAGSSHIQRTGCDTSGRDWRVTRHQGINAFAYRLPQNKRFFVCDSDCAAFTEKVPTDLNMRYLDLVSKSGCAVFSSITPGLLSREERAKLRTIYLNAEKSFAISPSDWMTNAPSPQKYLINGVEEEFIW